MNLGGLVEFWARWRPTEVAMAKDGVSLRWAELELRTRRLAVGLRARGVRPGDRVGILGMNSLGWCELALATLRAGAAVVPLNIRGAPPELAYLVDNAALSVIAYDSALASRYAGSGVLRVALDDRADADVTLTELAGYGEDLPVLDTGPGDRAVIAYTSGTTGYPKGAVLSHGNLLAVIDLYTRWEGWNSETTMLCCVPLAFTGGIVNNFLVTYGIGGTLLLEEFDPARALELIVSAPVTVMGGVPIMFESIAAVPGFAEADLSALRTAFTGGARVAEALLRTYEAKGVHIRQAYSLTEATGCTTLLPREHFFTKRDSAGVPAAHTRVRILDDRREPLPAGAVGEIVINGPQVCQGYWNDPAATAEALVDGWLHTGDLGSLDADGFLRVVDRKKDMIISGGLNVYPAEVERVVGEFPGVAEVAAIGTDHERWGETVAIIVSGEDVDPEALYQHCRRNLADYKVPRYIRVNGSALPRGMSGKILRRVLRDEFDPAGAHRTAAR